MPARTMDTEAAFFRVHARLSGVLSRVLTPKFRTALEFLCLFNAFALLLMLVVMHVSFVGQVTGFWDHFTDEVFLDFRHKLSVLREQQVKYRKMISGLKDSIVGKERDGREDVGSMDSPPPSGSTTLTAQKESPSKNKPAEVSDSSDAIPPEEVFQAELLSATGVQVLGRGPLAPAAVHYLTWWWMRVVIRMETVQAMMRTLLQELVLKDDFSSLDGRRSFPGLAGIEAKVERMTKGLGSPVYIFAKEKGYLLLPESAKLRQSVTKTNISLSATNPCFGGHWQRLLITNLVGYDTVLMNSLLQAQQRGYLYNLQTKEVYTLTQASKPVGPQPQVGEYLMFKLGVLTTSLFVLFTSTMSVSYTLRETQSRMLRFTVHLQHHARHRLPTFRLITLHVLESLVFVPIMIGILFFLFEFFSDQLLAFLLLSLVWLCEVFALISVQTMVSMLYFPRFFFLYLMAFHIYFFSYNTGFSYLAFFTTAAFLQHIILYFWNRHEIPALQSALHRVPGTVVMPPGTASTLHLLSALAGTAAPPPDPSTGTPLFRTFVVTTHTTTFEVVRAEEASEDGLETNDRGGEGGTAGGGRRGDGGDAGDGGGVRSFLERLWRVEWGTPGGVEGGARQAPPPSSNTSEPLIPHSEREGADEATDLTSRRGVGGEGRGAEGVGEGEGGSVGGGDRGLGDDGGMHR